MTDEMHKFLLDVNNAEIGVTFTSEKEPYYLKGIITQCDEWITEGWRADNDTITPEMYAAALLNEASTQDECVKNKETHPNYPRALRAMAMMILDKAGHGNFYYATQKFKLK